MSRDLNALPWRKSTRSGQQGQCVEVATISAAVAVRDSKNPAGPMLAFDGSAWRRFAAAAKSGQHDL